MTTLADVKVKDFLAYLKALDKMDDQARENLCEAGRKVPLIDKLLTVHANMIRIGVPDPWLKRSSVIVNTLAAVHFLLEGRAEPGLPGAKSGTSRRARPRNKG